MLYCQRDKANAIYTAVLFTAAHNETNPSSYWGENAQGSCGNIYNGILLHSEAK